MYILGKKLNCHLNLFLKILNWQFNSTLVNLQHITSNTCSIIHARQPKSPETTLKRWCSESHGALTGLVPSQTYAASPFTCSDKQFASTSSQTQQGDPTGWMLSSGCPNAGGIRCCSGGFPPQACSFRSFSVSLSYVLPPSSSRKLQAIALQWRRIICTQILATNFLSDQKKRFSE